MAELDERHHEVMRALDRIRAIHHACSLGQIAAALKLSKQGVVNRCADLRRAGLLEWSDGVHGSMRRPGTREFVGVGQFGQVADQSVAWDAVAIATPPIPTPPNIAEWDEARTHTYDAMGDLLAERERLQALPRKPWPDEVPPEEVPDLSDGAADALLSTIREPAPEPAVATTRPLTAADFYGPPMPTLSDGQWVVPPPPTSNPVVVDEARGTITMGGVVYTINRDAVRKATADIVPAGKKAARAKANTRRARKAAKGPDTRTPEQIEAAKAKMAAMRAMRKPR